MDSDSEDEIFFGPITAKEEAIAAPLRNRKTEVYVPGLGYLQRRSSVPSLSSLEEEDYRIWKCSIEAPCSGEVAELITSEFSIEDKQMVLTCKERVADVALPSNENIFGVDETDVEACNSNGHSFCNQQNSLSSDNYDISTSSERIKQPMEGEPLYIEQVERTASVTDYETGSLETAHNDHAEVHLNISVDITECNQLKTSTGIAEDCTSENTEGILEESLSSLKGKETQAEGEVINQENAALEELTEELLPCISESYVLEIGKSLPQSRPAVDDKVGEDIPIVKENFRNSEAADESIEYQTESIESTHTLKPSLVSENTESEALGILEENTKILFPTAKQTDSLETVKDCRNISPAATAIEDIVSDVGGTEDEAARPQDCYIASSDECKNIFSTIQEVSNTMEQIKSQCASYEDFGDKIQVIKGGMDLKNSLERKEIDAHHEDVMETTSICTQAFAVGNISEVLDENVVACFSSSKIQNSSEMSLLTQTPTVFKNGSSTSTQRDAPLPSQDVDSGTESYGTINKGLIYTHSQDIASDCSSVSCDYPSTLAFQTAQDSSLSLRSSDPDVNSSAWSLSVKSSHSHPPHSGELESNNSNSFVDSILSNDDKLCEATSPSNTINSPNDSAQNDERFNDTIEEMEMLLKYGLNYVGAEGVLSISGDDESPSGEMHDCNEVAADGMQNESIVSPRKSSVMSSVSYFDPRFNSTSVPDVKKYSDADTQRNILTQESLDPPFTTQNVIKNLPPPKPPRNAHFIGVSPEKPIHVETCTSDFPLKSDTVSVITSERKIINNAILENDFLPKTKQPTCRPGTSQNNPSTPRPGYGNVKPSTPRPVAKPKQNVSTNQQNGTTSSGISRSVSLNLLKENKMKTPVQMSPSCLHPRAKTPNLVPRYLPPKLQTPRSATSKHQTSRVGTPRPALPEKVPKMQAPWSIKTKPSSPVVHTPKSLTNEKILTKAGVPPRLTPSNTPRKPPIGQSSKTLKKEK
ncbi:hypothetical protein SK128_018298, partial [Halocaridina rubra]